MATYKVLQDIEAEDKFLGPLTLKQFIFASVAAVSIWLVIFFLSKDLWVLTLPLYPTIIIMGFLAFPWGRDQPTEIWLLAKIKYYFKPRKRVWDQTGIQQLVKITAPQKVNQFVSDNLSQTEVRSRLKALADTIDTRGWAIKNSIGPTSYDPVTVPSSDRLVAAENILPKVLGDDSGVDDIFDPSNMHKLDSQIEKSSIEYKENIKENLADIQDAKSTGKDLNDNFWFLNQPQNNSGLGSFTTQTVAPPEQPLLNDSFTSNKPATIDEKEALQIIESRHVDQSKLFHNHKSISPTSNSANHNASQPVTPTISPDTIRNARNNDQVIKNFETKRSDNDEVIVSLH